MAYTLNKAVARLRSGSDTTWQEVDISAIAISDLYTTYYKLWLFLNNPLYGTQLLYVDLDDLRPMFGLKIETRTIPDWLASLGNTALPTTLVAPTLIQKPALFQDAWIAGYSAVTADYTRSPTEELPEMDKHDLLLTRPMTDYNYFARHALVSVNGLFHQVGASPDGIYVVKGADTWRKGNDNQLGIYSFSNVADIVVAPITPSMVMDTLPGQKRSQYAYINLGGSVVGKTVFFVIGGYLHALDYAYQSVGDGIYRINICQMPLLKRIFESGKKIDLSSLNLETTPNNPDQVVLGEVFSDEAIKAYLSLSQSFAVVVNTPTMYVRRHLLEATQLPGRFYAYESRHFPLLVNHGEVAEYTLTEEDGVSLYSCVNNLRNRYKMTTTNFLANASIDSSCLSDHPVEYSQGYLLEFGYIS